MKKKLLPIALIMIAVLMTACSTRDSKEQKDKGQNPVSSGENTGPADDNSDTASKGQKEKEISGWIVYWDSDILTELSDRGKNIGTLCYFASYFKEDHSLFLPEEVKDTYSKVKQKYGKERFKSYLTFVNDIRMNDGTSKLKDTELLYQLLETKSSRDKHIADILSMAGEDSYDGIEIDYEAIREDKTLWHYFTQFAEELYQQASKKGLKVRILLEPNAPVDEAAFPKGPEYVIMCYNLFGYGTQPGPKADEPFLEEMVRKMKGFHNVNFALATGGFDFEEGGAVKQLTEEEAILIKKDYGAETQRDDGSRCVVFSYTDKAGKNHEVWYADKAAIDYWLQILENNGEYKVSLWRLGGNVTVEP